MSKNQTHDECDDPLAEAARVVFRASPTRAVTKSVAAALGVSYWTAGNWMRGISRVSPWARSRLAALIRAELLRQELEERAVSHLTCEREIAGNDHEQSNERKALQVENGHKEVDCGCQGRRDDSVA
jgi:hypothetical protein